MMLWLWDESQVQNRILFLHLCCSLCWLCSLIIEKIIFNFLSRDSTEHKSYSSSGYTYVLLFRREKISSKEAKQVCVLSYELVFRIGRKLIWLRIHKKVYPKKRKNKENLYNFCIICHHTKKHGMYTSSCYVWGENSCRSIRAWKPKEAWGMA